MSTPKRESVKFLEENGPKTLDELDKDHGVYCKLGGITTFNMPPVIVDGEVEYSDQVYYVYNVHEPEEIVAKWMEANEKHIERVGAKEVSNKLRKTGEEWVEPIQRHLGLPVE